MMGSYYKSRGLKFTLPPFAMSKRQMLGQITENGMRKCQTHKCSVFADGEGNKERKG